MKALFIMSMLVLMACGSQPASAPTSLLSGKTVNFYSGNTFLGTVYFGANGTFIVNAVNPNCTEGGTWTDNNPGQSQGTLTFINSSDTCPNPTIGTKITDNYIISNGE